MARYIRLYRSPENVPGNILGFSSGIAHGAYDKELHQWFRKAGYLTTQESKAQRQAHLALQRTADSIIHKQLKTGIQNAYRGTNREYESLIPTESYYSVVGIPIPIGTVSSTHLHISPEISPTDISHLALCLSSLKTIWDGGLRQHYLVDNRETPAQGENSNGKILAAWGIPDRIKLPDGVIKL